MAASWDGAQESSSIKDSVATPVSPTITKHYKDIHLDIDLLFVNKIPFLLAKSRDIGSIHCKTLLSKHDKRVQNGLQSIVIDYQAMGFKVTSAFGDGAFKPLVNLMRHDLHVDLSTCAADSNMSQAENAIRFVKERLRYIQCETPFKK